MMKRLTLIILCVTFSVTLFAQARGGEITRKSQTTTSMKPARDDVQKQSIKTINKKKEEKRSNNSKLMADNSSQKKSQPANIQPTPIEDLPMYNIVVGTMRSLDNVYNLCHSLKEKGYSPILYYDDQRKTYRIMISGTDNEEEALSLREKTRQAYPDAWILYVINGKEERYF